MDSFTTSCLVVTYDILFIVTRNSYYLFIILFVFAVAHQNGQIKSTGNTPMTVCSVHTAQILYNGVSQMPSLDLTMAYEVKFILL